MNKKNERDQGPQTTFRFSPQIRELLPRLVAAMSNQVGTKLSQKDVIEIVLTQQARQMGIPIETVTEDKNVESGKS